ncbi:hypothetical protein, partial [Pseudomonas aeruginosa]|uniref:hypothetical protein n=1 Tax=Pseudomonas aeruginosa TaxID=287 RepID=UPI003C7979C3
MVSPRSARARWPCVWWRLWAPCACARISNASVCSASSRNTTGASSPPASIAARPAKR